MHRSESDVEGLAVSGVRSRESSLNGRDAAAGVGDHAEPPWVRSSTRGKKKTVAPNVNEHKASLGSIGVLESANNAEVVRLPFLGISKLVRGTPVHATEVLERVARGVLHEGKVSQSVGESLEGDGQRLGEDVAAGSVGARSSEVLVWRRGVSSRTR